MQFIPALLGPFGPPWGWNSPGIARRSTQPLALLPELLPPPPPPASGPPVLLAVPTSPTVQAANNRLVSRRTMRIVVPRGGDLVTAREMQGAAHPRGGLGDKARVLEFPPVTAGMRGKRPSDSGADGESTPHGEDPRTQQDRVQALQSGRAGPARWSTSGGVSRSWFASLTARRVARRCPRGCRR